MTMLGKPADLNIAAFIKVISDWAMWLKKISPLASTLFILLNVQTLLKKRATIITLLILVPLLVMTRRADVLRVIFAIAMFWIFLEKFSSGIGKLDRRLAVFLSLYALVILVCIFVPSFYIYDGSLRYKFILESHNALSILVFLIFIYVCETLLQTVSHPAPRLLKIFLVIAIYMIILIFLFIKSRIYIGISFFYLCIITFKRWRQLRVLLLMPVVYVCAFLALSLLTRHIAGYMDPDIVSKVKQKVVAPNPSSKNHTKDPNVPSESEIVAALVMNQRISSSSTTGRMNLVKAFSTTFRLLGWKKFIYSNSVEGYMEVKRHIPNINIAASSLTENTYLTTILTAGFVGLLLLLYMSGVYVGYFVRHRQLFSLAFFALLLAAWLFEESTMFAFSLMAQFFALSSINRIEKEDHESSTGN